MVDHMGLWGTDRPRPLESAQCSLCGIVLPKGLMMPDGGHACADIRWYCKDSRSCTERWTAHPPRPARAAPALEARTAPALEAPTVAVEAPTVRVDAAAVRETRVDMPALDGA